MKKIVAALAIAAAFAAPGHATTIYTSSASFLPHVAAGAYTEGFDLENYTGPTSLSFSGGGYAYTVSSPLGVYANGDFLGVYNYTQALTIAFTGGAVTAVGANFFNTSSTDAYLTSAITITLSDGTTTTLEPSTYADTYRGFTSDIGIASLTLTSTTAGSFVSLDNLTVGAALVDTPPPPPGGDVPEPASLALTGAGLLGLAALRRRRAG